jgi:hypothetical protein
LRIASKLRAGGAHEVLGALGLSGDVLPEISRNGYRGRGDQRVDGDQILWLLAEREAARVEWLRLERDAGQIAGLIEECPREIERLTVRRETLSGLVSPE